MISCWHHKIQHWYTIKANDNRISLSLLLLVFNSLPFSCFYFSSTKQMLIEVSPDAGFV